MQIVEIQEEFPFPKSVRRRKGVHLTEITYDIIKTLYRDQYKDETEQDQAQKLLQFEKGFLWEKMLEMAFKKRLGIRPKQLLYDGIWCSPDGVWYGEHGDLKQYVGEYKATRMSCCKPIDTNKGWMMQAKAYCYALGIPRVRFRVFHIAGDYKAVGVDYKVYDIAYGETELMENWEMIRNHARSKGWL